MLWLTTSDDLSIAPVPYPWYIPTRPGPTDNPSRLHLPRKAAWHLGLSPKAGWIITRAYNITRRHLILDPGYQCQFMIKVFRRRL